MDLFNNHEVELFVDWVVDSQDEGTADKCRELIDRMKAEGRRSVEDPFELLAPAHNEAHGQQIKDARRLVRSPFDSRIEFE